MAASCASQFKGKSGKTWKLKVKDRRVAKIVKACQDLPGQDLFQYLDEDGAAAGGDLVRRQRLSARDHRARDHRQGFPHLGRARCWPRWRCRSSKHFDSEAKAKKNVRAAIERVAARLGNTPTICRKCYVHPEILACYLDGDLLLEVREEVEAELARPAGLRPEEAAVLTLLEARLDRDRRRRDARSDADASRASARSSEAARPGS